MAPLGSPLTCPPRWGTARTPERPTLGGRVGQIATELGKPLMPHQQHVMDVALELLPNGKLAYSEVDFVLPRQQGKTEGLMSLMTHRALGFKTPQRIMYTTQTASEARKKWEDIHIPRLDASPFKPLYSVRKRLAAEAILWANGSAWAPGSTTGKTGGTGDTLDLGIIDEAWSREDNRTELGMRPAMLTRPNHQLWVTSMVPGLSRAKGIDSAYLKAKISAGKARVAAGHNRGAAFFMWAAQDNADPGDPATWWNCMPALGHTIDEDAIQADYDAMDLIDFCAEYLGIWADARTPRWLVVSEMTWGNLCDPSSVPVGPVCICVDATPEHSWVSISMAGLRADGNIHVELVDRRPGTDWVVQRVVDLVNGHDVCAVVIDPNGPASSLIVPIELREDARGCPTSRARGIEVARPNLKESAASCARFYDMTNELQIEPDPDGPPVQRVYHLGQAELTAAIAGARKYTFGDQWRWARAGMTIDLSPLYAATHAAWGLAVFRAQDYNVLDSVF